MKFRKKPIVVEAEQFWPETEPIPFRDSYGNVCKLDSSGWYIRTLESERFPLTSGDWIIRGVQGEFYVCKPGIFDLSYEAVDNG